MAETNEKLALLYNESPSKENRQKIFLEIKNNLKEKTDKIINLWVKRFSNEYDKYDDRMTYRQIADMMILSALDTIQYKKDDFIFEQWYIMILKNSLFDYNQNKVRLNNTEINMDFQEEPMENIISGNNWNDSSKSLDNEKLYAILKSYIDKIDYWSSKKGDQNYYKKMFMDSLGFNEDREPKSYAELARLYDCTRQNVRDCCARYTKRLVDYLKNDNRLEELRQYL